jgi:hypothetical protein
MIAAGVASAWVARLRAACLAVVGALVVETASCATVCRGQEPAAFPPLPPTFAPDIDVTEVNFNGGPTFPAPLWTSYALTDALFWGRDNQATNQPLIVSEETGAPLVSTRDLRFPFSEGVRAFYGQRAPDRGGWEIGYFGVYGQSATRFVAAAPPDFLQFPDPIGGLLTTEGETSTIQYSSVINSAEANLFTTSTEWRDLSGSWLTVDWLAGFRYVGVEEQASITTDCCVEGDTKVPVPYTVRTRNNLFGAQIGNRSRWTWQNWAFEGWAKAGLFGNAQEQIQSPLVDYLFVPVRPGLSASGGQVSFVGDINTSVIYRLTDVWGIRAGYNLIWIDGLALAPNQFDFTNDAASGTRLVSGGGIFMHGANLGLEARW